MLSKELAENDRKAINAFTSRLRQSFGNRIHSVKLFGSKARGDDVQYSDIDLFIVMDRYNLEDEHAVTEIIVDINLEYDVVLSPIVRTVAACQDPRKQSTPFFRHVQEEGILI